MTLIAQVLTDAAATFPKQEAIGWLSQGKYYVTLALKKSVESTAFGVSMLAASGCGIFVGYLIYARLVAPADESFCNQHSSLRMSGSCASAVAAILTVVGAHEGYRRYFNPSISSTTSTIITVLAMAAATGFAVYLEKR